MRGMGVSYVSGKTLCNLTSSMSISTGAFLMAPEGPRHVAPGASPGKRASPTPLSPEGATDAHSFRRAFGCPAASGFPHHDVLPRRLLQPHPSSQLRLAADRHR